MLDITTAIPGASPAEVEQRVTLPIENLVHEISGVEYVGNRPADTGGFVVAQPPGPSQPHSSSNG